ncbi:hypothetical protein K7472_31440 [Streptomyces sp. PTM05]|uniref:Resolvase/invertase-type recombinase catalytic domain-containing protein n=1 Tax=Streptantibioticus parmotrematis TaxID=2873249 RepID=A0ABS7R290_9ACTN|nr:hypothetical protein [Streptantibioticus parmotrematis]MBY8889323.1 hypothetical protein [Streptantibioticus parmotrematis]
MEPLTEHHPVSGPLVYGFLRLVGVSAARQTALRASLVDYCRTHELQLSGVFMDRYVTTEPRSAAFTGLLDALALPDVYGVVAPALSHLGPKHVAAERNRWIETTGARLLLARRPRTTRPSALRHEPAHRSFRAQVRVLGAES